MGWLSNDGGSGGGSTAGQFVGGRAGQMGFDAMRFKRMIAAGRPEKTTARGVR